jgi:cysteine-rich repeat protein
MRSAAWIGAMGCALLGYSGCTNDYDGLAPGPTGATGGGASSSATGGGANAGGASSASTGAAEGGATTSSSASAGGAGTGGAPVGGAGPGGSPQGGDGGTGGMPDPLCGNGMLDPGEECDGGTPASGDGCSSTCALEGNPRAGCPTEVEITAYPLFIRGDTSGGSDFTEAPGCFAYSAPDAVFRVIAPAGGVLSATVEAVGGWDGMMALRGGCDPGDGYCGSVTPQNTIERAMSGGAMAHVLVTGSDGESGPYLVTLTFE